VPSAPDTLGASAWRGQVRSTGGSGPAKGGPHGGRVERSGHAQRTGERAAALGELQAGRVTMQVGAAAGQHTALVDLEGPGPGDDPQQLGGGRAPSAPDAGADRRAQPSPPAGAAAAGSGRSTSGRMSIRQPVSRAASRAFCPSLPIASESW
jgi:hypothetical protein